MGDDDHLPTYGACSRLLRTLEFNKKINTILQTTFQSPQNIKKKTVKKNTSNLTEFEI